jgi:hypothetical protein
MAMAKSAKPTVMALVVMIAGSLITWGGAMAIHGF